MAGGLVFVAIICIWVVAVEVAHPPNSPLRILLFAVGATASIGLTVFGVRPWADDGKARYWLLVPAAILMVLGGIYGLDVHRGGNGVNLAAESRAVQAFFAGAALGMAALFVVGPWRANRHTTGDHMQIDE